MAKQLGISVENLKNYEIADRVPLFPVKPYSKLYPGDTEILGKWVIFAKNFEVVKLTRGMGGWVKRFRH